MTGSQRFVNAGESDESKCTQNKVPDSLIVEQRPRQVSLVENLNATNCERIDIHGGAELAVASRHQLWCLPPESSIWTRIRIWYVRYWKHTGRCFSTDTPHLRLHFTLAKIGDDTTNFVIDKDVGTLLVALFHLTGTRARCLTLRSPCNTPLSCK